MTTKYMIRRSTLTAIADAIREVTRASGPIPVTVLDEVLASGVIPSTAPTADKTCYVIERQTLVDIADMVRAKSGETQLIPVVELADRIRQLGIVEPSVNSTAVLGLAVVGWAVLGNSVVLEKLATPVIYLE